MQKLTEDNWKDELEKHPFFRTKPLKEDEKLPELFEALQAIKYEDEESTLVERALAYKEDGNYHFKSKNYEAAIKAFTKGIDLKCDDDKITSVLFSNRATAHYNIKNFRSCLLDSKSALSRDPDNFKAIMKCVLACLQLKYYEEAKLFCSKGLNSSNIQDKDFYESKLLIVEDKLLKIKEMNEVKEKEQLHSIFLKESLQSAFKQRNIKLMVGELNESHLDIEDEINKDNALWDAFIEAENPFMASPLAILNNVSLETIHAYKEKQSYLYLEDALNAHTNNQGILHWPVLFMYPQHEQTDFISDFSEEETFESHIKQMFPDAHGLNMNSHPDWDFEKQYNFNSINIYWEDKYNKKLVKMNKHKTLQSALYSNTLKKPLIFIQVTMLTFIILLRDSTFTTTYLKKYDTLNK